MIRRLPHVDHNSTLETVIKRLDASREICYDAETSGLDWKRNHTVGHVITFGPHPDDSHYLPFRHAAGGNLFGLIGPQTKDGWFDVTGCRGGIHPAERKLIKALSQVPLIFGHNLAFDLKFLSQLPFDMRRPRFEDTMINAPLLDEWQGKYSLAYCANLAGVEAKKVEIIRDHIRSLFSEATDKDYMGHYWRLAGNDPIAVDYAAGDGTTTWQLRDWQMPQISEQGLQRVHDVESRLIPVLARMSIRGIRVDEDRLTWLQVDLNRQIDELLSSFPPDFNARSSDDVRKWCTDHGATDWPMTQHKTNPKPSFPEQWLETNEPGRQIVAVRRLTTLRDSFVMPMIETHLFNGRVHTEFNQLRSDDYGTVTGRLSSSNPNLQQVPKRNKMLGRLFRSIFIPDKGMVLGSADYRQCEPVLLAYYSRCKALIDGFMAVPPVDPHQAVANATGRDRDTGKRCNQLIITGGGPKAMSRKFGIPLGDCERIFADYFRAMPEVKTLQKRAARKFRERGYLLSLLERRARLHDRDKDYTGMNRLLQCGNADIIKSAMVQIDDYLESEGRPEVYALLNIHDDLLHEFSEDARKHYRECLRIMADFGPGAPIELDLPLGVDPGEGNNWAISTYGPEK